MSAFRAIVAALVLLCFGAAASADTIVPPLTGRVVDRTGTLTSDRIAALDSKLRDFEQRKGSQVAVLLVPTIAPEPIEQFSLRVAEAWKIGRRKIDDGAILVVAKDDRALRIEVGYGLEGALTDVTAKRIIDEVIVPQFRSGDFAGGIEAGVDRILKVIDGEPLPAPAPQSTRAGADVDPFNPFMLVVVIIIGGFLRGLFGRLYGALGAGAIALVVAYYLTANLAVSAAMSLLAFFIVITIDGYGSGGSSGGWSSGSSGSSNSGGFSGGGGSFGGGGASGRW